MSNYPEGMSAQAIEDATAGYEPDFDYLLALKQKLRATVEELNSILRTKGAIIDEDKINHMLDCCGEAIDDMYSDIKVEW